MSYRNWIIGVVASMAPWMAQAQDLGFDAAQRADGFVVYVDFEPAGMARNWADSHRATGANNSAVAVRPELDRHLVVAIVDELTRERVGDAQISAKLTRTNPPGSTFSSKLELMEHGAPPTYGTMVTVDPLAEYSLELMISRSDEAEPVRLRFGPARVPASASHGDLRKRNPPETGRQ